MSGDPPAVLPYLLAATGEEVLVESFQAEENLLATPMLFTGFLCVFALKMLGPGRD